MSLLKLYDELKERVVDYIDTAYLTNNLKFNEERRKLVKKCEDIIIFKEPKFEPLKRYVESSLSPDQLLELVNINISDPHIKSLFIEFLESFAPIKHQNLYQHQIEFCNID